MKILIELEIDQEAYDRKYGPGTEWWEKYIKAETSEYGYAPEKLKASWDAMLRDILTEGLYDWTQLHEEALKMTITIP